MDIHLYTQNVCDLVLKDENLSLPEKNILKLVWLTLFRYACIICQPHKFENNKKK